MQCLFICCLVLFIQYPEIIYSKPASKYEIKDHLQAGNKYLSNPTYNLSCWSAFGLDADGSSSPECALDSDADYNVCRWERKMCIVNTTRLSIYDRAYCLRSIRYEFDSDNKLKIYVQRAFCFISGFQLVDEGYCTKNCTSEINLSNQEGSAKCCCYSDDCNKPFEVIVRYMSQNKSDPNKCNVRTKRQFGLKLSNYKDVAFIKLSNKSSIDERDCGTSLGIRQVFLRILLPLFCFTLLLAVFASFLYTRCAPNLPSPFSDKNDRALILKDNENGSNLGAFVKLLEVRARGRFGCIYKAVDRSSGEIVAVKIFATQDRISWANERRVYKLEWMNHTNILKFLAAERHRYDRLHDEYWIITEYHELGSLFDFLKVKTVTFKEMMHIAVTMAAGLAYMHESIPSSSSHPSGKPSVAHRDFKSKNVLLKQDLTSCIADFGLALILDNDLGEVHSQVGTPRYMSPEVLEGAISFTPISFLRIDVYAFAMVFWELISRCTEFGSVGPYMLPFENEVGSNPTVLEMKDLVVQKRRRPVFNEGMKKSETGVHIKETIEDCWDQDADARLSVMCVYVRLKHMIIDCLMEKTDSEEVSLISEA